MQMRQNDSCNEIRLKSSECELLLVGSLIGGLRAGSGGESGKERGLWSVRGVLAGFREDCVGSKWRG